MEDKKSPSRLRRGLTTALAVFMAALCAFMFVMTIFPNRKNLIHALRYRNKLDPYLPADGEFNALELFVARVRSLDNEINSSVYRSEELGQINATLQYALGKRLVSTGSAQMVRLNGGYLYDLQEEQSMVSAADEILELKASLPEDLPFLFVYEHPTVYDLSMLPPGYDVLDYGEEAADEVTALLRQGGLQVIDTRDVLKGSGYPIDRFLMRTDQHWSTFAALVTSRALAEWLRDEAGLPVDPSLLDVDRFETETLPRLFLGKYGQRIGTRNIAPDDMHLFWPNYETELTRHSVRPKSEEDAAGDFREAIIRWDRLETDGKGWNIKAYGDYGLAEVSDSFTNAKAPKCKILVFKDSYSSPVGAFLSLIASEVYTVDLRQVDKPALYYVNEFQPDVLITAYSQQMLRDREYQFAN